MDIFLGVMLLVAAAVWFNRACDADLRLKPSLSRWAKELIALVMVAIAGSLACVGVELIWDYQLGIGGIGGAFVAYGIHRAWRQVKN